MGRAAKKTLKLRLIRGSLSSRMSLGELQIVASPKEAPPFRSEAFVSEEDTFLVMSADPLVRDPRMSMPRIMSRLIETHPETPGSVLIRGKDPVQFLAIVHDFNEDPSLKEEWVERALEGIFKAAENLRIRSLALPLIGTRYGFIKAERLADLLGLALKGATLRYLKRLWLIVPSGTARDTIRMLKERLKGEERVGES